MIEARERLDLFDYLIVFTIAVMILLAPLAMGSVSTWARDALFLGSLFVTALWVLQAARRGRLIVVREPAFILIGLFILFALLQVAPLDHETVEALSPGAHEVYSNTLPGYPDSMESSTLSVNGYNTAREIRRLIAFVLIFLVIANTFRTRWQVAALLLAMIAIGSFEALYGFAEQFSGAKNIFWNERKFHTNAVTGTFINKNHFSGLLEMIIPVTLGLFMAVSRRHSAGGTFQAKAVDAVSSSGFNRQIILAALIVIMVLAVFFSLSRAGILSAIFSWTVFLFFIGLTAGFRKYTMVLLLLVLAILCIALGMGSELVIETMEDATSGESVSWHARLDLWNSALRMIGDFPLFGTGLGTFKEAFERYQSPRFGDRYADFLHNDWLQIICETGVAGSLLAGGALVLLLTRLTRKSFRRHDMFCRWIAMGVVAGAAAIVMHSLFDYNLSKITSNGLVFSVMLGLLYAVATMSGRNRGSTRRIRVLTLPLGPAPVRAVLAIAAVGGLALLGMKPWNSALADVRFNNYLASPEIQGRPDHYFFLPVSREETIPSSDLLKEAAARDDRNPLITYYLGIEEIRNADFLVKEQAMQTVRSHLGSEVEKEDPVGFQDYMEILVPALIVDMFEERKPYLEKAGSLIGKAIATSPAVSRFHLTLASIKAETGMFDAAQNGEFPGVSEARRALWLAPNKPGTLFQAGKIVLIGASSRSLPLRNTSTLDFIESCFRRSIASDIDYAKKIYPLISRTIEGDDALIAVTPDTIKGYEYLTGILWDAGKWNAVLGSLEKTQKLCELAMKDGGLKELDLELSDALSFEEGASGFEVRDPLDIMISISRRRATVLSILNRFEERKAESRTFQSLFRKKAKESLIDARQLRNNFRYTEAHAAVREILRSDWNNPEALILAAELARMPDTWDRSTGWNGPTDHLFRLVIHNKTLDPSTAAKALAVLDEMNPTRSQERFLVDFIRAAVQILSGKNEEGIRKLEILIKRSTNEIISWDLKHLISFYHGLALERSGRTEEAKKSYLDVLGEVPTHLETLRRLAALDGDIPAPSFPTALPGTPEPVAGSGLPVSECLNQLQPDVPVGINFGGKIVLLGYSLDRKPLASGGETWEITYFWEFLDRIQEGYQPVVYFRDTNWKVLFQDNHRIREGNEIYPVEYPRCGAIVLDRRTLTQNQKTEKAEFLTIGIQSIGLSPRPPLIADSGDWLFRTSISFLF